MSKTLYDLCHHKNGTSLERFVEVSIASPRRQSPHLRGKIDIHSIWIVKAHPTAVQQLQRGRGWWWNMHQQMLNLSIMLNGSK